MSVILETTMGDITIDLYTEARPRTCLNFLKLCKVKYYNFSLLHLIQRNFMIQTGDPTGTGRGGESIFGKLYGEQARYFEQECTPKLKHQKLGTVSMVNNGNDMHASQFFITTGEDLDYLDGVHTVFGEVSEGIDVVMKINDAICDEQHRPYKDIRISHTVILDDPFDDPAGMEVPDRSPEPTPEILKSDRIGAHEDVDETEGKTMEEIEEEIKDKEAKARATILEMVGDLPEADVRPPENVLFVCKLNPVTTDEDLEIIFSRFGTIKSCEIIRDKKSGDSLQYAFIEFEKEEDCENAFFKMDNVLIDDRRIHVDFSQSVAMLKWKGKGKGVEDLRTKDQQQRAEFTLKSKATTQQGNYDMVFDEQEVAKSAPKKKKHQKEKTRSRSRSPQPKHKERRQSSSPAKRKEQRRSSASSSPERSKKRRLSRSPEKYRTRRPSPSPERRRDKRQSSSPNRRRDKYLSPSPDRRRDRRQSPSPDRYRERQRQSRGRDDYSKWNYKQKDTRYDRNDRRRDYNEERRYRR